MSSNKENKVVIKHEYDEEYEIKEASGVSGGITSDGYFQIDFTSVVSKEVDKETVTLDGNQKIKDKNFTFKDGISPTNPPFIKKHVVGIKIPLNNMKSIYKWLSSHMNEIEGEE